MLDLLVLQVLREVLGLLDLLGPREVMELLGLLGLQELMERLDLLGLQDVRGLSAQGVLLELSDLQEVTPQSQLEVELLY